MVGWAQLLQHVFSVHLPFNNTQLSCPEKEEIFQVHKTKIERIEFLHKNEIDQIEILPKNEAEKAEIQILPTNENTVNKNQEIDNIEFLKNDIDSSQELNFLEGVKNEIDSFYKLNLNHTQLSFPPEEEQFEVQKPKRERVEFLNKKEIEQSEILPKNEKIKPEIQIQEIYNLECVQNNIDILQKFNCQLPFSQKQDEFQEDISKREKEENLFKQETEQIKNFPENQDENKVNDNLEFVKNETDNTKELNSFNIQSSNIQKIDIFQEEKPIEEITENLHENEIDQMQKNKKNSELYSDTIKSNSDRENKKNRKKNKNKKSYKHPEETNIILYMRR